MWQQLPEMLCFWWGFYIFAIGFEQTKSTLLRFKEILLPLLEKAIPILHQVKYFFIHFFETKTIAQQVALVWKIWALFLLLVLFHFKAVEYNFLGLSGELPSVEELEKPQLALASEVYSSDGQLVGKYYRENRTPVAFEQISPEVIKALLATEDIRFEKHSGIDLKAIFSIPIYVITGNSRGGSTITQQLAKNLYKTRKLDAGLLGKLPFFKTVIIKTKEWITAIKLERSYTKKEIITMYLNTVDFGSNSFGIKTAARTFFSKPPHHINTQEAATLVGMLKATTTYNPLMNYGKSLARRNTVLQQMIKYQFLTQKRYETLSKLPIDIFYSAPLYANGPYDYYGNYLTELLNDWCTKNEIDLYTAGLKIYISIDKRMQDLAKEAVKEKMNKLQKMFYIHWGKDMPWIDKQKKEIPNFIESKAKRTKEYWRLLAKYKGDEQKVFEEMSQPRPMRIYTISGNKDTLLSPLDSLRHYYKFLHAALMTVNPFDGNIKAWVGGIDYENFQYDHVRQAKRQPGSTFKPFVYAAAINMGYPPCYNLIEDKVTTFFYEENVDGKIEKKRWTPLNADGIYTNAKTTLRHAIGRSINTVTAQLAEELGGPSVIIDYARRMGITSKLDTFPSVCLGASEVSLYEMVGAYTTFLNKGVWQEPILLLRIEDSRGNVLHEFSSKRAKVLTEEDAWLMMYMLQGPLKEPKGTAQGLFSYNIFQGNELAGKTGTSSDYSDGWFIGLTKDLITGVWVGGTEQVIRFKNRTGEGSKTALPIYGRYMEKVYENSDSLGIYRGMFPPPPVPIRRKYICPTVLPKDTAIIDSSANDPDLIIEDIKVD